MIGEWAKKFKWETPAQEQGFKGFQRWWMNLSLTLRDNSTAKLFAVVAFFIQKNHESHEWWAETVGDQISRVEDQVHLLQKRVRELEDRLGNR